MGLCLRERRCKASHSRIGVLRLIVLLRTTPDTPEGMSGVVRRCALHARNPSLVKPAKTLHGSRRPMVTSHRPNGPGQWEGWPGFSRLFAPSRWSDLPEARLVLAFPPLGVRGDAVGRPGVSASGFQAARVGSIRVRCATVSRDGRMRETNDDVLDRQGIHPAPSGYATASVELVPCIARVENGNATWSRQGTVPCKVTGRLSL